jgi:(E)-4-hydroxy-3-methylbut-2-enyl-diphosphate synthase
MQQPIIQRHTTRAVRVGGRTHGGGLTIGGGAPVSVQSMTKTPTRDAEATLAQVRALTEAGADLVRVAVPTKEDTAALRTIVAGSPVPIVADVHFHFERALEAIDAGVAKIRLNPGNIRDRAQVRRVIAAAAKAGVAIRVGVNEGSVVERAETGARAAARAADLSRPLDELMEAKLAEYLQVFEEEGFDQLVLSAKSHDAVTCVAAYRRLAARWDYPLHLGVTHAGTAASGAIRSAAALGALLAEGIGDTIRISYAGDPVEEVKAACELLASLRLRPRKGVELIACPTCGRVQTDIVPIVEAIRVALAGVTAPLTVAIMGCVVNGPGEAESADVAVCAGKGKAVLYRRGQKVRTLDAADIVRAVVEQVRALAAR